MVTEWAHFETDLKHRIHSIGLYKTVVKAALKDFDN